MRNERGVKALAYAARLRRELETRSYSQYNAEAATDVRMADVAYYRKVQAWVDGGCRGPLFTTIE